jgi:hypothetical protein
VSDLRIDDDRKLIRIMLRELDLFEQMWQDVLANLYRAGAAWISSQRNLGALEVANPEATAVVLFALLTYYPLRGALIRGSPGDIAPERFLTAWIGHATHRRQFHP